MTAGGGSNGQVIIVNNNIEYIAVFASCTFTRWLISKYLDTFFFLSFCRFTLPMSLSTVSRTVYLARLPMLAIHLVSLKVSYALFISFFTVIAKLCFGKNWHSYNVILISCIFWLLWMFCFLIWNWQFENCPFFFKLNKIISLFFLNLFSLGKKLCLCGLFVDCGLK